MNAPNSPKIPAGYTSSGLLLGTGQTAKVYLANHASYGTVALKVLKEEAKQSTVLTRMFTNEVQITRRLQHPHIIGSFEGKPTEPGAFLTLEYCEGGPLDTYLLKHGAPDIATAYRYILEIGAALQYSHDRRVLHRDIKPANVLLTKDQTRLADFGTGTFASKPSSERVGTAFYMAPELFQGANAHIRSDIYSLGIFSYELLTGQRPFIGETQDEVMISHLHDVPRNPNHIREDVPTSVASIVLRAMSRTPERRYKSVREYCQAFSQASGVRHVSSEAEITRAPVVGRSSRVSNRPVTPPASSSKSTNHQDNSAKEEKGVWGKITNIFGRKER